tara:strand:- start:1674 stop:2339 length:666 start_codon:yes stop_codon:yes gene_type:complete
LNSWLNKLINASLDIDYLFIYGNIDQDDKYNIIDDELHIKCDDGYDKLNEKICNLYKYLNMLNKYDKIIKCDDDNFIITRKFVQLLNKTKNINYFGPYNNKKTNNNELWKNLPCDKWYGPQYEGAINWFSKDLLKYYCENITQELLNRNRLEDKLFSDIVRSKVNITIYNNIKFIGFPHYINFKKVGLKNVNLNKNTFNTSIVLSNINTEKRFRICKKFDN